MKIIISKSNKGGKNMRNLSEAEILSLSNLLKMEKDGLAVSRAMHELITDDEFKRMSEAGILAMEQRTRAIQQFINENHITETREVR